MDIQDFRRRLALVVVSHHIKTNLEGLRLRPQSSGIIIVAAFALAVGMAHLRPSFATPTHQDGGKDIPDDVTCTVTFRHPGYPDEHNIIMVLPALDDPEGGIHYETALIACAVVAGNRWDGFLSEQLSLRCTEGITG